jgi:hypothetical protein
MCEISIIDPDEMENGEIVSLAKRLYKANNDGLGLVAAYRGSDGFGYAWLKGQNMSTNKTYEWLREHSGAWRIFLHARLATAGGVGFDQTHPIEVAGSDADADLVMHNGVVSNNTALRSRLDAEFTTAVDSEVIPNVVSDLPTDLEDDEQFDTLTEQHKELSGRLNYVLFGERGVLVRSGYKYQLDESVGMCTRSNSVDHIDGSKRTEWLLATPEDVQTRERQVSTTVVGGSTDSTGTQQRRHTRSAGGVTRGYGRGGGTAAQYWGSASDSRGGSGSDSDGDSSVGVPDDVPPPEDGARIDHDGDGYVYAGKRVTPAQAQAIAERAMASGADVDVTDAAEQRSAGGGGDGSGSDSDGDSSVYPPDVAALIGTDEMIMETHDHPQAATKYHITNKGCVIDATGTPTVVTEMEDFSGEVEFEAVWEHDGSRYGVTKDDVVWQDGAVISEPPGGSEPAGVDQLASGTADLSALQALFDDEGGAASDGASTTVEPSAEYPTPAAGQCEWCGGQRKDKGDYVQCDDCGRTHRKV